MNIILKKEYGQLEDYVYDSVGSFLGKIVAPMLKDGKVELEADELPSVTRDKIFKKMFATEENKRFACLLLSTILEVDLDDFTESMTLYTNEFISKIDGSKDTRLDFVGLCEGTYFSIEMNNSNKLERNADYAHVLYAIGKKYNSVVQLNICNFKIRGVDKAVSINVCKGERRRSKIIYIDVYLPILKARYEEGQKLTEGERTILAMFTSSERQAKEIGKGSIEVKEFIEKLKMLKRSKRMMKSYSKDDDLIDSFIGQGIEIGTERGIQEGKEIGLQEGKELGLTEGREIEKEETALNMLKEGLPLEIVQKCTKLSSDKIKNIMTML